MNEGENLVDHQILAPTKPRSNTCQKTIELLLAPARKMTLALLFKTFGKLIGRWPLPFLITTIILLTSSVGIIGLKLRDNVRDGYTPSSSRARHENIVYRDFLGSEGDPVMATILMIAKDNQSMHRVEYLEEAWKQWLEISTNLSVQIDKSESLKFTDICGHYCQSNAAVGFFLDAYKSKIANNDSSAQSFEIAYPITTVMGFKLHMERNFFGVTTTTTTTRPGLTTNIEHLKIISFAVLAEVKTLEDFERLGKWELELFKFCREYSSKSSLLDIHVISAEIVDTEMNKDAQKMTPYFIVGFSAMLTFVIGTVYASAIYYGFATFRILFIGCSCALVPTFAIMTTLGLNNLLGNRTNSPMLIMPFLINGIGVNDAFLTLHAWQRQPSHWTASKKLAGVLHEVGPSITTTTLTNVITFIIGWMSPTEEMSIFCMGCALALFFAWLYTIIFFCPLLVLFLNKRVEKKLKYKDGILKKFLKLYSKIVCNRIVFLLLVVGSLVYWSFGLLGSYNIEARLDTAKILPLDTPIRKPNRLIEEYVWKEFYPVNVLINKPLNITDPNEMLNFENLVHSFESMTQCRGSEFSISWIRDYHDYFFGVAAEDFDYDSDVLQNTSTVFDYHKLRGFLSSPVYKHHAASLQLNYSQPIPVRKFVLTFVYQNNTSWDDRVKIMIEWRNIADSFSSLNASVWNVNAMFVDQMLSLKPLAAANAVVTLACMLIVCVIFIQTFASVVVATLAILSITIGVTGYLSFWDLDLDPVSLCAVLVSIGMAVDFVAHTTYHYTINYKEKIIDGKKKRIILDTPELRVYYTLTNVGWPMIQAGISTVLCILPLVHLQNYLPLVFVKTITLVVIWGLFHGLTLLPSFLAQIPLRWFNYGFGQMLIGAKSSNDNDSVSDEDDDDNDNDNEVKEATAAGVAGVAKWREMTPLTNSTQI